ncbi:MAG: pilus assembly protein PilM [Phycisphaerae bacterium]|nr:pilus assembly protein PilM [Phycisphaerae bacterium]
MASWFRKKTYPIGIDFGRSGIRLLQLAQNGDNLALIDAASAQAPIELRNRSVELLQWRIETISQLLKQGNFKGRKVVTGLPGSDIVAQHLLMDKMSADQLKAALPFAVGDKFPFPVNQSLLRHIVAGEVYEGDKVRQEVIVMAVPAVVMNHQMQIINQLKLEIEAINIEALAVVDSFSHSDSIDDSAVMIVDLGYCSSKVVIAHAQEITFCRTVKLGVENICQSITSLMPMAQSQAEQRYIENSTGILSQENDANVAVANEVLEAIEPICDILVSELRSCIRYHDLMFASQPVSKVVFVGGQARDKRFCQNIARSLGLSAQIGDPLRKIEISDNIPNDIDPQNVNPQWTVAFGLSYNQRI